MLHEMSPEGLDKDLVSAGFDQVADTYDTMVALNPGYHQHLQLAAESLLERVDLTNPRPVLLDLGCGSGLSTMALLAAAHNRGMDPTVIGIDASPGMLAIAAQREWPEGVSFRLGRAEELAAMSLPRADGVLACYLLRNVTDVEATLQAIATQLHQGAPFVAQDYSVADSEAARRRWSIVNQAIILPLSTVIARNRSLYEYLHRSVDDFMGTDELGQLMFSTGYEAVESRSVDGWQNGILHLVRGTKPLH